MDSEAKKENILIRLKNILKQDVHVKLWLPPYLRDETDNGNNSEKCLLDLANSYSSILRIDTDECLKLLLELQKQLVHRLQERNMFKTEGVATFRVKVSGQQIPEFSIQFKLCDVTDSLKERISAQIQVPVKKLKLISNGKVLKDGCILEAQSMKHGCTILALVLQNDIDEDCLAETRENHLLLEQTKQDLEYINRGKFSNKYFSITNQTGENLNLPPMESKILLSAMTLHEKGRSAFRNGQHSLALVFFFEADAEFKNCRADLLERVDNYGLLNLDIVWAYLHLKILHCLSDAEARLEVCEETFYRCYGKNLERLNEIKGTSGNERVLFMRLHLLQGIILHCKNRNDEARSMFQIVEREISDLKVDAENIKTLCDVVHCSKKTAKLALQATYNNLPAAVDHIMKRWQEKSLIKEHQRVREFADHHVCRNGSQINLTVLKQMHDMGYTNLIATYALVPSNNDIDQAVLWIENFHQKLRQLYPDYVIDLFMSLEFDFEGVWNTLQTFGYQLNEVCVETLIEKTIIGRDNLSRLPAGQFEPSSLNSQRDVPSTSDTSISAAENDDLHGKEIDAVGRLQNGISNSEDSHLDTDLKAEEHFLNEYKSFLV